MFIVVLVKQICNVSKFEQNKVNEITAVVMKLGLVTHVPTFNVCPCLFLRAKFKNINNVSSMHRLHFCLKVRVFLKFKNLSF